MRNFLTFCLILNFYSAFASAQTTSKTSLISDEKWEIYKGNYNEFSVAFPTKPNSIAIKKEDEIIGRVYRAYYDKTFYLIVSCINKSSFDGKNLPNKDCPHFGSISTLISNASFSKESNIKETEVREENLTKTQTAFTDSEGFNQVIQQFRTVNFSFIIHTLSEHKDNANVERFLKSFAITSKNAIGEEILQEKINKSLSDSELLAFRELTQDQLNSSENYLINTQPSSTSNISHKAVKIINKPAPSYTKLALYYGITGNVRLRILFLANGKIGTIEPSIKLPFGLTNNAINSARNLKFEPALSDEKPIAVTKTVEYVFSIL